MLREISQTQKGERCLIPLVGGPRRSHLHRDSRRVGPAGGGVGSVSWGQSVRVGRWEGGKFWRCWWGGRTAGSVCLMPLKESARRPWGMGRAAGHWGCLLSTQPSHCPRPAGPASSRQHIGRWVQAAAPVCALLQGDRDGRGRLVPTASAPLPAQQGGISLGRQVPSSLALSWGLEEVVALGMA